MLDWFAQIDWFAVICWLSAVSLIIAGLAGTVIPAIPGLPLIAERSALIGWAGGFELIGWGTIADTVSIRKRSAGSWDGIPRRPSKRAF